MIRQLVAMNTISQQSNIQFIEFARNYLETVGAVTRLTFDADKRKANLFATIGPAHIPGIVLSGHTDVVPVEGQDWSFDPFTLVERDGKLFGRGTSDMKSFIALCLAKAHEFAAAPLKVPVHFAFSYDEEVGCIGVRGLIKDLENLPVRPSLCIIGEPTEMRVIGGHKGKKNVRCRVHGKECHSALNHKGVNAVEIAADMVAFLRALQRRIRQHGPFDHAYDPPYTTVHTGVISGGTALNIVPNACDFEFEIRNLPSQNPEELMAEVRSHAQSLVPEMLDIDPGAGFTFDEYNTTPGFDAAPDDEAVLLAQHLTGHNDMEKVAFTTEAGLFAKVGIPTVVCGPGSIMQAHKPDEFITLEQVALGEKFLDDLLKQMI